ncbi:MAG: hypothetical protein PHI97_00655 [Desulfobulbus sp.]|nr:hypothetical protein [Desulfobulbus sp.]
MTVAPFDLDALSGSMPIAAWGLTEEGQTVGLVAVTGGDDTVIAGRCRLAMVPPGGRYVHLDGGALQAKHDDGTVNELKRILDHLKKDCSHAALVDFVLNPAGNRQGSELAGHQYEWLDQHTGSCGDDHYGTISFRIGMVYAVFEYNC